MMEATQVRTVVAYGIQRFARWGQLRTFWGDKNNISQLESWLYRCIHLSKLKLFLTICTFHCMEEEKSELGTLCERGFVKWWVLL